MPKPLNSIYLLVFVACLFSNCNSCKYGCENGICQNGNCVCETFWEGDACERKYLETYAGNYVGSNSCIINPEPISYLFKASSQPKEATFGPMKLNFNSINHFVVPEQTVSGALIEGEGQVQLNRISIRYWNPENSNSGTCLIEAAISNN